MTKATYIDPAVVKYFKNQQILGATAAQGVGCTEIAEAMPTYQDAPCEKVIEGKNNAYIVLGRDRPGTEFSGCGGRGDTQCGSIDIVTGRVSSVIMDRLKSGQTTGLIDKTTVVDNNFFADAARIYITQRAINIDEYLGFANEEGSDPTELSAAVIKSDCTRIVGRESVRIYAGGAAGDGFGPFGEKRANGSNIQNPRIELIVGNRGEEDMQPAVLGGNLVSYLARQNKLNDEYINILTSLITQISSLEVRLAWLDGGFSAASSAAQNIENFATMTQKIVNQMLNDAEHMDLLLIPGKKSFLSKKVYIT